MNPAHRDGWHPPPGTGARDHEQQQTPSQRAVFGPNSTSHPSHRPSSGPSQATGHFVPYQQPGHNLPNLSGLNQSSPQHPPPPPQQLPSGQGYHSSGPSQTSERSRDNQEARDREAREVHVKEEQDAAMRRERDARERQHIDQLPPHQSQAGPILHQPVAVGPRTVHGPNGLLGNPGAIAAPNSHSQMGAPTGPANIFAGGPVQPPNQRAQPGQAMQPGLLVPFVPGAQAAAVGQGQQPILNDALSYLDQVKVQFVEHPDVYNRFLDIMKDFKSGAIDTPGVIDRVSSLFAGNPDLIQGFNTFLPPGYRIECGAGDDPNAIRVTTPMGNTVLAMPAPQRALSNPRAADGEGQAWNQSQTAFSPSGRPIGPATVSAQLAQAQQAEAREREHQAAVHQQEQRGVSQLQNAVSAAANGGLPRQALMSPSGGHATPLPGQEAVGPDGQPVGAGMEKRGPVEFNHAISYVNKIKNRFSSQPDIYKQFLEILQTYQRESKPIQDVYGQVTRLFNGAPDLLEDFKQFLPESAAQAKAAAAARQQAEEAAILSNVRGEPYYQAPHQTPRADHRLPPVGNFAPTPTVNKDNKRKRGDRQGTAMSGMGTMMPEPATGPVKQTGGLAQGPSGNKRPKHAQARPGQVTAADMPPLSPTLVPALPEPLPPTHTSTANGDELGFFDRVKKTIGNKNTMNEFLKLCNLYSQDLIDKATLVHRARSFIGGNPELFKWFQNWAGQEDAETIIIDNRGRIPSSRVMLSNCRGLGPSYRLLPKRERLKPCSGRDELCNEVLNDDWASHPTWASEDSGFIAHRKNIHEEGLHKIEEERHDYDFNIEACSRTVQLLDQIALKLLHLSPQERESLEISAGIGGQSETIHKRVLMKLYGRDKGLSVIESLHARPYAVVPVVLNRLKQKLEEWKAAQREWEKVWRDQTQKMFWKSLDHQAVNAKQADKRQFQTKTLVAEIQTKHEEQKRQRYHGALVSEITKPQMSFDLEDTEVILDATYLVLTYAEQMHSTDFPRLTTFIKELVPMFFGLDVEWFNYQLRSKFGNSPAGEIADDNMSAFDDPLGSRPRKTNGKKDDLRRGVLERGHRGGRAVEGSNTPLSRASTPDNASRADEEMSDSGRTSALDGTDVTDTWAEYPPGITRYRNKEVVLDEIYKRQTYNLYGNTSIYCFLRMFVILYERLNALKRAEDRVYETVKRAMAPKPAGDLGLIDKLPNDFFGDVSAGANYYRQMLRMFDEFIKNEVEFSHIEETLRRFYLDCGWQLYSFDKLCNSLVRFGIAIMSNEGRDKSWEMLQLFKKDRAKEETTFQDEMNYRKQVERLVKEGDVFKVGYEQNTQRMTIKILKKEEPTFDTSRLLAEDLWRVYVSDYLSTGPTHGSPHSQVNVPLLKRNVRVLSKDGTIEATYGAEAVDEQAANDLGRRYDLVRAKEALEFKIGVDDFKMHFQRESDEFWHQPYGVRVGGKGGAEEAEETLKHRLEAVQDGLVMNNGAMKGLSKEDVEGRNGAFRRILETGNLDSAQGEDAAMEDA